MDVKCPPQAYALEYLFCTNDTVMEGCGTFRMGNGFQRRFTGDGSLRVIT